MKNYETDNIKNVALVGASGSGKTTLAECMMYEGGLLERMGSIDRHSTISDYHDIEQERNSSVYASILHTEWRGTKINLIDTPGMDDFAGEWVSSLKVCDTALVVVHAQHGVEVGTELVWKYLSKFEKPLILVINQLDHARSDFYGVMDQVQKQFGEQVVLMQYPYNQGEGFNAIIDLLKMVMYKFPKEGGKPEKLPIPVDEVVRANELHNVLVEAAAMNDESLMEMYFEKGALDEDEMSRGLRVGMLKRQIFPVFCVASKRDMGSGRLMGFIGNVAPAAQDMAPLHTVDGALVKVNDPETTLFVFKSSHEKHAGAMSYFKVCSGEIRAGAELKNLNTGTWEKLTQIFVVDGKNRTATDRLYAGDIGATVRLKSTQTNHTLSSAEQRGPLEPIVFPEPRIWKAIIAKETKEEEKMAQALHKLKEDDPTFRVEYSRETKQTLIYGQGSIHLQTIMWRLENEFHVQAALQASRISYRETIQHAADASYKHKKQSGGAGQFGEVYLKIQPYSENVQDPAEFKIKEREEIDLEWGGKFIFCNCIVGGVIDQRFLPAIQKGILEVIENAPLTGSYARDIIVYVYDGKMHPVDSNEISFKIAGAAAFKQAFLQAGPRLLEPIYAVEILLPDSYMGDVMTDLQGRRAIVEGYDAIGASQRISAKIPLAELEGYQTALNSLTQGRAAYSLQFSGYQLTPAEVQANLTQNLALVSAPS